MWQPSISVKNEGREAPRNDGVEGTKEFKSLSVLGDENRPFA
jgi:hypothetical protein